MPPDPNALGPVKFDGKSGPHENVSRMATRSEFRGRVFPELTPDAASDGV